MPQPIIETELKPWPPDGATRAELLAVAESRARFKEQECQREIDEHEATMREWRETIADRLLTLIPRLEAGEDIDFVHGGALYEFRPPERHGPLPCNVLRWQLEKRDAIATLPEGVVSAALRKVLSIEPGE